MTIRLVENFEELIALRDDWERLLANSPSRTVFQTFEWLEAWWLVFSASFRLRTVLAFDGASLAAAAPLVLRDTRAYGRRLRCLEFAGGGAADYTDFLYADDAGLRRLLGAIRSRLSWDVLDLNCVPAASPSSRLLTEEFPGWRGTLFTGDVCRGYVFDGDHDGSDILRKKSIRRHVSGLHRAGAVEIHHLTEAEAIEPYLEPFFKQHLERRSVTDAPSNFLDPHYQTFYRRLIERLAPKGWLLFTVVTLDGEPVAFHYGFVFEKRLVWYKPSFSIRLARLSPGEVLIAELFKYCQAHKLVELDFTVGDDLFKTRFCNVERHNVQFRTFRSGVLQSMDQAKRLLKNRAKRVKGLEALVERFKRQGQPRIDAPVGT